MTLKRTTAIILTDDEKAMWNKILSIMDELETETAEDKCEDDTTIDGLATEISADMRELSEYFA